MRPGEPGLPSRPLLRPGVRVCRRGDGVLQVGLHPALRVVAPDSPATRLLLEGLRHGAPLTELDRSDPAVSRLWADLLAHRMVVDADALLSALGEVADPAAREQVTALFAEAGPDAGLQHERRRATSVHVGGDGPERALARCRELLDLAGFASDGPPDLVVHLARSELDRASVDEWLRHDQAHLLVSVAEGHVQLGPFVVPGRTACLRCIDAHHTELDPRRSLVVHQYADSATAAVPEPVPHDLLDLAIGLVARDVVNWVEGRRPRLWSATLRLDSSLELAVTPWPRHAGCGCAWPQPVAG